MNLISAQQNDEVAGISCVYDTHLLETQFKQKIDSNLLSSTYEIDPKEDPKQKS